MSGSIYFSFGSSSVRGGPVGLAGAAGAGADAAEIDGAFSLGAVELDDNSDGSVTDFAGDFLSFFR